MTYSSVRAPATVQVWPDMLAADDIAATRSRLEALARTLDTAFRVPGTSVRIGADALLNVIPGVGTLAAKGLAGYIVWEARRLGVPRTTLLRMAGNVGVDFVISAIPIVGWFGDAFFRANSRNIALLIRHIDRHAAATAHRPTGGAS
jgi:Domain of unknown function (DUF4112)